MNVTERKVPALVMVGGFLGSGKTTLILKAAESLHAREKKTAVILNDQDAGLVDTEHALARNIVAHEVPDGCFCCRFSEFVTVATDLASHQPDVIFAEPVGSCLDLAATVIRPIQTMYSDRLRVAPFTVLLDPTAVSRLKGESLDSHVRYLMTHQLAEADLVCTTRQDIYTHAIDLPIPIDFRLSGKTGFGVEDWLDEILSGSRAVGSRPLDVNYGRYAEAEAALGWLNLHAQLNLASPQSPALVCGPLLDMLEAALSQAGIFIAHLKVFDRSGGSWVKASICANGAEPVTEGDLLADAAKEHQLALNLRAVADPAQCEEIILSALANIDAAVQIRHLRAFRPPAPSPEYLQKS